MCTCGVVGDGVHMWCGGRWCAHVVWWEMVCTCGVVVGDGAHVGDGVHMWCGGRFITLQSYSAAASKYLTAIASLLAPFLL